VLCCYVVFCCVASLSIPWHENVLLSSWFTSISNVLVIGLIIVYICCQWTYENWWEIKWSWSTTHGRENGRTLQHEDLYLKMSRSTKETKTSPRSSFLKLDLGDLKRTRWIKRQGNELEHIISIFYWKPGGFHLKEGDMLYTEIIH
jgi:hypothetical protein